MSLDTDLSATQLHVDNSSQGPSLHSELWGLEDRTVSTSPGLYLLCVAQGWAHSRCLNNICRMNELRLCWSDPQGRDFLEGNDSILICTESLVQ